MPSILKNCVKFGFPAILFILSAVACARAPEPALIGSADLFTLPTGLAVDSQGNIYVMDSGSHRILKFAQDGSLVAEWGHLGSGEGEFNCYADKGTICGIAVDSQDNIFVVDKGNYRIQKFASDGTFLTAWGSQGVSDGQFSRPIYVAVDAQGNVFVTDDRNPVVQKFDNAGQFVTKWGSLGSGDGQFSHATGIAVDSAGSIYVADYDNRRIQKFDNNGQFLLGWETGVDNARSGVPEAIAVDSSDRIYVTDSKLKQVELFDSRGRSLGFLKLKGSGLFNRIAP